MTLEETIRSANNGNIDSMISLGRYYHDEKNIDESEKWFQTVMNVYKSNNIAADDRLAEASYEMASIKRLRLIVEIQLMGNIRDCEQQVYDFYNAGVNMLNVFRSQPQLMNGHEGQIAEMFSEAAYQLSFYYYMLKDYNSALKYIPGIETKKAKILYANCLKYKVNQPEDWVKFYNIAKVFENDIEYANTVKERLEEVLYADCMFSYSVLLNSGMGQWISPSVERSYNVLTMVNNNLKVESMKNNYLQMLSHYKRTAFGKLIYEK